MSYLVVFVAIGGMIGFWYWRYFQQVKAAGGREALAAKQMREEFGLADGEKVTSWWMGVAYIGALRPGLGAPTLGDRFGNALSTMNKRGAQVHLCLTDRGRIGISMEPLDGLDRDAAIVKASFGSQTAFFRPFALVERASGARLLTFDEAFPGTAYPRGEAPSLRSVTGSTVDYQLVHWWGADGHGMSFWADPAAVPAMRAQLAA